MLACGLGRAALGGARAGVWAGAGCAPQGLGCTFSGFTFSAHSLLSPSREGSDGARPSPTCQRVGSRAAPSPCSEPGQQRPPVPLERTGLCEDGVRGPCAQALGHRWGHRAHAGGIGQEQGPSQLPPRSPARKEQGLRGRVWGTGSALGRKCPDFSQAYEACAQVTPS